MRASAAARARDAARPGSTLEIAPIRGSRRAPRDTARDLRNGRRDRLIADTATAARRRPNSRRPSMQWTQPAFEDLRFGFEITMYIASR
jgi:coenzyme PQQ precursor peptide PqqA